MLKLETRGQETEKRTMTHVTRTAIVLIAALCAVLWIGVSGCSTTQMTADQADVLQQRMHAYVGAMRDAGMSAHAYMHLKSDRIGSIDQVLRGPFDIDILIVGEAKPPATNVGGD